jgi:hypothetical protein
MTELIKSIFDYFHEEHGLILTESEVDDIIHVVAPVTLDLRKECARLEEQCMHYETMVTDAKKAVIRAKKGLEG